MLFCFTENIIQIKFVRDNAPTLSSFLSAAEMHAEMVWWWDALGDIRAAVSAVRAPVPVVYMGHHHKLIISYKKNNNQVYLPIEI